MLLKTFLYTDLYIKITWGTFMAIQNHSMSYLISTSSRVKVIGNQLQILTLSFNWAI